MIYCMTPGWGALGEDDFWGWFQREFQPTSHSFPTTIESNDVALVNAARCQPPTGGRRIALVFELYPELTKYLGGFQQESEAMRQVARQCDMIGCTSPVVIEQYADLGVPCIYIPLGVDTDFFFPNPDAKLELRRQYGIPPDAKVGFWGGTNHPMKGGEDLLPQYVAESDPTTFWIFVWKSSGERTEVHAPGGKIDRTAISQGEIRDLMWCSDFFLCTSRLRPHYIFEWEAMSCGLPFVYNSPRYTEGVREFVVNNANPRQSVFDAKWDRHTVKNIWKEILQ